MNSIVFLSSASDLKEGGEFSLLDVIRGIKGDYQILCVCKEKGALSENLNKEGIEILFCDLKWSRKFKYFFSNYSRLFFLYLKLKKFSPDLIYSNSGRANPMAARLAHALNAPLITHLRDLFDPVTKDKYAFRYSRKIIACSQTVAALIKTFNNRVRIIYNALDPNKFSPGLRFAEDSFRKRLNLDGYFLIGNAGTIAYRKGYFEFVQAAKIISESVPEARFLILGEALPGKDHIMQELKEKVKQNNLEQKFVFTGFVKEIAQAMASLDVLLFPPRYEAFGRVIIEAFACGVPVISTFSGGPEEIIEDKKDGFLCKIGDVEAMARAVINLYEDNDLYKRISENVHQKFLQRFAIDRMVKEVKSTIEEVINQG